MGLNKWQTMERSWPDAIPEEVRVLLGALQKKVENTLKEAQACP